MRNIRETHAPGGRPLRLAAAGPINHHGGSSAAALFCVVDEWLRAGHEVDFFSPGNFIDPARLVQWRNFRYFSVELARWKGFTRVAWSGLQASHRGPAFVRSSALSALNQIQRVMHEDDMVARIRREHSIRRYDAFVSLNRTSDYRLSDLMPVVSWTQGPPSGESEFIKRDPDAVRRECGWDGWTVLRAGYLLKDAMVSSTLDRSTAFIAGSEWARAMWMRAGVSERRIEVLPFPVDLARFRLPGRPQPTASSFVFLWAGRIVPRKRIDLALAALEKVRRTRPGVRLLIAGSPGYEGLVTRYRLPPFGAGAEALGVVSADDMPALFARSGVVLQPSENENFGTTPVEALAAGLPTVLGPTNGTGDFLLDTAFRFDRYEVDDVAAAMERAMDAVLADPAGIARRAQALAEQTLSNQLIAQRAAEAIREWVEAPQETARPPRSRGPVVPSSLKLV
jgi:glycosyltransferase involved in cell wall biosynthesis